MKMMSEKTLTCTEADTRINGSSGHHFSLCLERDSKRSKADKIRKSNPRKHLLTEEQERFVSEFSPEITEKLSKAFTTVAAESNCKEKLVKLSRAKKLPVILMILEVTANAGKMW